MTTVSMLHFRHHAEEVLAQVRKGHRVLLTYRGKPVARLEPVDAAPADADDPFYRLGELSGAGDTLSNRQIDAIVYGQ
jgi:prevent-host-death family protein